MVRDQKMIQTQKDQQDIAQRTVTGEIYKLEIEAGQLQARLQAGRNAEQKMEEDRKKLAECRSRIPVSATHCLRDETNPVCRAYLLRLRGFKERSRSFGPSRKMRNASYKKG